MIIKKRHLFKKEELTWEIDKFGSMDLVIAEIELPYEGYKFKIPKKIKNEIIMEVTNFPQFFNNNLALKIKKQKNNISNDND